MSGSVTEFRISKQHGIIITNLYRHCIRDILASPLVSSLIQVRASLTALNLDSLTLLHGTRRVIIRYATRHAACVDFKRIYYPG